MADGCGCIFVSLDGTGGCQVNGSATVQQIPERHNIETSGGVRLSGRAPVYIPGEAMDWGTYVWTLQESGNGTPDEYKDIGTHSLDGTGKGGIPDRTSGPFCLYAQEFDGSSYIHIPDDYLGDTDFSVSCWVNLQSFYKQRALFSRGHGRDTWVFSLGHSVMRHIAARFNFSDGTNYTKHTAHSYNTLDQDRWYHVAVSYEKTEGKISFFINGNEDNIDDSTFQPPTYSLPLTSNAGYIGAFDGQACPECYMLDMRLYPHAHDQTYWKGEYENYCSGSFYTVSNQQTSVAPF